MPVVGNVLGAAMLTGVFASIIATAEIWKRWKDPNPELARKVVHVFGGVGSLLFPFFVTSSALVLVLAAGFGLFLWYGEKRGWLKCLSGVRRQGKGSEYFPLAVAGLFYISQDRLWLYVTSILILTVSDSAAALVGGSYGRFRYRVGSEDQKSLEGSLTYCLLTYVTILTTLLLMTELPRLSCVLIALLVSVLLTGIEAVSVKGLDNLFVPIITCFVLLKITAKTSTEIAFECMGMLSIFLVSAVIIHTLKILTLRNGILFAFFAYANWSIGSLDWAVPVFVSFILYALWRVIIPNVTCHEPDTQAVGRVLLVPVSILVLADLTKRHQELYGAFLVSCVIGLVYGAWIYWLHYRKQQGIRRRFTCAGVGATGALLVVGITMSLQEGIPLLALVVIPLMSMAFTLLYDHLIGDACLSQQNVPGWAGPMWIFALIAAALYFGIQSGGVIETWHPEF